MPLQAAPATRAAHGPALDDLPIAALAVDLAGELVAGANALATALFAPGGGELAGVPLAGLLPGVRAAALAPDTAAALRVEGLRAGVPFPADVRMRRLESRPARALILVAELGDAEVAAHAAAHFEAAFDHAPIGMALFNCDGEYIRVNSTLCDMLGRDAGDLLGRRDQELTHPEDRAGDVEVAWRILRGELDTHQTQKRFVRPDGSIVWTIANLTFLRDEQGRALAWLGQFQDITELRRTSHELRRLAEVDPLTSCLNRRRGLEALEEAVASAATGPGTLAVLMIDLDRFKDTNDNFGHLAGDDVLRASSDAIAACLEDGHDVVRYGGEEFMAILPATTRGAAVAMAERIRVAIERLDVRTGDRRVPVRTSVGVATLAGPGDDVQGLIGRADTALYRAKAAGRNRVVAA